MEFCEIKELNNKQMEYLKKEGFRNVSSFYALKDNLKHCIIYLSHNKEFDCLEFTFSIKGKESYSEVEFGNFWTELKYAESLIPTYKDELEVLA